MDLKMWLLKQHRKLPLYFPGLAIQQNYKQLASDNITGCL